MGLVKSEVDEVSQGSASAGPCTLPVSSGSTGSWARRVETMVAAVRVAGLVTVLML